MKSGASFIIDKDFCRNLTTRLTEHKRATRKGDVNNHIAEHHRLTNHTIDWDSAQCLTYSTNYFQRLTLESWFINLEQTLLNRCHIFACVLSTSNSMISSAIWGKLATLNLSKTTNCACLTGSCSFISSCTRNHMISYTNCTLFISTFLINS